MPAKRGRPSTFTKVIADEICERMSLGEPLAVICRDERMPAYRTAYHWQEAHEDFSANIARAREMGFDHIAVAALDIADATENDTIKDEDGTERPNTEWITRSRLRVETRLKLLAKWDPKRYGDKLDLTSGGEKLGLSTELEAARKRAAD